MYMELDADLSVEKKNTFLIFTFRVKKILN